MQRSNKLRSKALRLGERGTIRTVQVTTIIVIILSLYTSTGALALPAIKQVCRYDNVDYCTNTGWARKVTLRRYNANKLQNIRCLYCLNNFNICH